MKDKKFTLALIVIVLLVLALVYILLVAPSLQGFLINQEITAKQDAVKTIMQIVDQQGYVVLTDNNESVVLVKYEVPAGGQLGEIEQPPA